MQAMTRICVAVLFFVGLLAWANAAMAQERCAPRDTVIALLTEKYGEELQGGGRSESSNSIFMTFANPETGTWTIIEIRPEGVTCMKASGTMYREPDLVPAGSPT